MSKGQDKARDKCSSNSKTLDEESDAGYPKNSVHKSTQHMQTTSSVDGVFCVLNIMKE